MQKLKVNLVGKSFSRGVSSRFELVHVHVRNDGETPPSDPEKFAPF